MPEDIAEIDKNFKVSSNIDKDDIKFYNIDEKPFKIYGIHREGERYCRMTENVAKDISEGVYALHCNTAGGRVRFITDSGYVAIHAEMDGLGKMPHFAFCGSIGFDLYVGNDYKKTFIPPIAITDGYEGVAEFETEECRKITINFPLYSNVRNLYIGLREGAVLKEAAPYKNEKPLVYYGSSITQGGCASRPGMSYQSIISRRFNYDFINLGFSGNAKAEDGMIEYIKNLDMSAFIYDYDHNAPTVQHLQKTHEKMFAAVRNAHPDLPVIIMTRPVFSPSKEEKERREIIETTYKNALRAGDENVYFIDGKELMALCGNEGTVDGCHPTDFGFASIAQALGRIIEKAGL